MIYMKLEASIRHFPLLEKLYGILEKKDPLQKKSISEHMSSLSEDDLVLINDMLSNMNMFLEKTYSVTLEECVQCYITMCREIIIEQLKFSKTGKYSATSAKDVAEVLYSTKEQMTRYMYGLALSIILWPNHFKMYKFYMACLSKVSNIRRYLEVGPGHGLFLQEALRKFNKATFDAVDISLASIDISKAYVDHLRLNNKVEFIHSDINDYSAQPYDFITIGEVLEHVDNPKTVLRNLHQLLDDSGYCFISTCANCPAIDHIYLFHDTFDIRNHLMEAKFEIVDDLALPVKTAATVGKYANKIGINYSALIRKKK